MEICSKYKVSQFGCKGETLRDILRVSILLWDKYNCCLTQYEYWSIPKQPYERGIINKVCGPKK